MIVETREEWISLARLSSHVERHDDVIKYMTEAAKMASLNYEERKLIFTSYEKKKLILTETLKTFDDCDPALKLQFVAKLNSICDEIIKLADFLNKDEASESVAHYKYILSRQYSDKAKLASEFEENKFKEKAYVALRESMLLSKKHLNSAHPLRLLTVFDFSTFYDAEQRQNKLGFRVVKKIYEKGVLGLAELDWSLQNDALLVLHELKERIDYWMKIQ